MVDVALMLMTTCKNVFVFTKTPVHFNCYKLVYVPQKNVPEDEKKNMLCSCLVRMLANQALALHYVHGQGLEWSCICVYGAQRGSRSDVNIGSRAAVCLK